MLTKFRKYDLLWGVVLLFITQCKEATLSASSSSDTSNLEVNLSTIQLVQLRGFKAVSHYVNISDGHILNVIRCTNPLINNGKSGLIHRDVVLFVHGASTNANFYIVNSHGAHPTDNSELDVESMSQKELNEILENDPNKNSLPFLLLSLGHEVWLLNRRGSMGSLGYTGKMDASGSLSGLPSSTNDYSSETNYWDYTYDDEISKDIPQTFDYILSFTGRKKLAYVGHSAGGLILMGALSESSDLDDEIPIVSVAVLWAPATYITDSGSVTGNSVEDMILRTYIGPIPSLANLPVTRSTLAAACRTAQLQRTSCADIANSESGYGGNQQNLTPPLTAGIVDTISTRQARHLNQTATRGRLHYYDFEDENQNILAYGIPEPPIYDVADITYTKLSLWAGNTDTHVPIHVLDKLIGDLSVKPAEVVLFDQKGIFFNHVSFIRHLNVSTLVNIPSAKTISTIGSC